MEKFIDLTRLTVVSGHGGKGSVSFRREKFVAEGGPNGGNGGKGGDVILRSKRSLSSFGHLYKHRRIEAANGDGGGGRHCSGKDGADALLLVPVGTIVKDSEGTQIFDFADKETDFVIARGGKGGLGNMHFATSTNQAPEYAQPGLPGEEIEIILEMKLIADIGLVGFPNAGKSTFIAAITNAKPKIADYPFTTLTPNLGIYRLDIENTLVIADIPGIIEGAHEGKGLGFEFLRHIERTFFLFYLVESTSEDPWDDYKKLRSELTEYSKTLAEKDYVIGISKMDLYQGEIEDLKAKFPKKERGKLLPFSSAARMGLEEFRKLSYEVLDKKLPQQEWVSRVNK